jgi:hypothetical protein
MEVAAKRRREAAPSIVPEQPDSAQNQPAASNMPQSKDAVIPTLQLRHAEGEGWCVAARWPDGRVEDIAGFKSEFEANEWIAKDFQTWLEEPAIKPNYRRPVRK